MDRTIDDATRVAIEGCLAHHKQVSDLIEEERRPLDLALAPLIRKQVEADGSLERFLEDFGLTSDDIAGKCEHCGKLLFVDEPGQRPYGDECEIVFCEKHGMTYGDMQRRWEEAKPEDDDEDEAEHRIWARGAISAHLAEGGSLDDVMPGVV